MVVRNAIAIPWFHIKTKSGGSRIAIALILIVVNLKAFPTQQQKHQDMKKVCKSASSILCLQTQSWMFIIIEGNEKGRVFCHSQAETAAI